MRPPELAIAIVGMGPRGLSVLERLLIRLGPAPPAGAVVIWAVDAVEHGPGRVWRTDQPEWLTMNATAGEVTVKSPDGHAGAASLTEWTGDGPSPLRAVDYPPRRLYGEYLKDVFQQLCAGAPAGVEVRPVLGEATRLAQDDEGLVLTVDSTALRVDKVVLATGHVPLAPTGEQERLARFAARHPACRYIGEDIAADMPLDEVPPGATVAVRGLGLTFYDVIRSFSVGRGGSFARDASGYLRYRPSGREPVVVAGSRTGLPFLARPRVSDPPETVPHPVVLTDDRIAALRARYGRLDFACDVEPLIQAELDHAYRECAARNGRGDPPPLRLDDLARPFAGRRFASPSEFQACLLDVLRTDVAESRAGPVASPRKAALEVLRQLRPVLPAVVDFGGLEPASHEDFLNRFEPLSYLLSAGPPDEHVEQLVALVEGGVVDVVGPGAVFDADERAGRYAVASPAVDGSRRHAEVLLEARVPGTDLGRTASPLLRQMAAEGLIAAYVNGDGTRRFHTGGLAITPAPFHVVDRRGRPDPDIYAIGVATDRTRWFTQVGTGRPGRDSPFCRDADGIAADVLGCAETGV